MILKFWLIFLRKEYCYNQKQKKCELKKSKKITRQSSMTEKEQIGTEESKVKQVAEV